MSQSISSDIVRICKVCGEAFHPTARKQFCCNEVKAFKCVVCGQEFMKKCTTASEKVTCSKKCTIALGNMKREEDSSKLLKKCKWCGEIFTPKSRRSVYCSSTHYQTCKVCGKQFIIHPEVDDTVKTCSKECRYTLQLMHRNIDSEKLKQRQAMLEKYGVENAMQIAGTIDKIKATNLKKYGSEWYSQTDAYKEQMKNTSIEKYGVDHHLKSTDVIAKREETVKEKYGVDNVAQSEEVKQKIKDVFQSKYNVVNVSQRAIPDLEKWNQFLADPQSYISDSYETKPTIQTLASDLGVCLCSIYNNLPSELRCDLLSQSVSRMEDDVISELKKIDPNLVIIHNDRTAIHPLEIDIYLPEEKVGIECNPTWTHNSSLQSPWGNPPMDPSYHNKKTKACQAKDIFLFHLFGYEWKHKREIMISMLRNILHKNERVLYARKCKVKEIDYDTAAKFLDRNHRQGKTVSSIQYGLTYNDELVAVMTFGKRRPLVSNTQSNDNEYELIRFCTKLNTTVTGGASKLLTHFIETVKPDYIFSYSDRAHTRGTLYSNLGFTQIKESDPGYVWVELSTDRAYNRVNAQKQNIQKFLNDDTIDLNKTEKEIMIEHGFVQVFDCGTLLWEWKAE